MKVEMTSKERQIGYLNYLVKTYNGITQLVASTKQRLQALPGEKIEQEYESMLKGEGKLEGLETIKGRIARAIGKEIKQWDIWETWLKLIPGIGVVIAAKLIILFHWRFIATCKACGGDLKKEEKEEGDNGDRKAGRELRCTACGKVAKEGLLQYRIEEKDFPTISKWWAYMGRHTIEGNMPKRKKGAQSNWSTEGRTLGFHIGEEFNRQKDDHPYKKFLLDRKAKHERNHPDWSKGHRHNAAKNEAVKLFLAHFWQVDRMIEGKPVSQPYAGAIMGHTDIIEPFYFEERVPA